MRRHLLMTIATVAALAAAMVVVPTVSAAQAPPRDQDGDKVIPIPVDDPVKAIAGTLFKPQGEEPFPAIVLLGGCGAVGAGDGLALEKAVIDHDRYEGFATMVVDSYAARGKSQGVCDMAANPVWLGMRAADAHAAKDVLAAMPGIDARRIFLVGYDHGGTAALLAADRVAAAQHKAQFAGVVAYYPFCGFTCGCAFSVPTLILVEMRTRLLRATVAGRSRTRRMRNSSTFRARRTVSPIRDPGPAAMDTASPMTRKRPRTHRRAPTPSSPRT